MGACRIVRGVTGATVDKSALKDALDNLPAPADVAESEDGEEVPETSYWASPEDKAAYGQAYAAAKDAFDNLKASQDDVDAALEALAAAAEKLEPGLLPVYAITYDLNGGTFDGSADDIVEHYPDGTVIAIHEKPVREGYTFLYWKGSEHQPGDEYTVFEDHTFVAQWEKNPEPAPKPQPAPDDKGKVVPKPDSKKRVLPGTGDATLFSLMGTFAACGMAMTMRSLRMRMREDES